jgi:hypothetical protein
MHNRQSPQSTKRRNGHDTVGSNAPVASADHEGMEPKGLPTSDRYQAETVHAAETDDHTKISKSHHQK